MNNEANDLEKSSVRNNPTQNLDQELKEEEEDEEGELHKLLLPDIRNLPITPPSSVQTNFVSYFAPGWLTLHFLSFVFNLWCLRKLILFLICGILDQILWSQDTTSTFIGMPMGSILTLVLTL